MDRAPKMPYPRNVGHPATRGMRVDRENVSSPGVARFSAWLPQFFQVLQWPARGADPSTVAHENTLVMRLQAGNFYDAGQNPLKVVCRLSYGAGNANNVSVFDVPANGDMRIPLATDHVRVEVGCVRMYTPVGLLTPATPDFWENIPPSEFAIPVSGLTVGNDAMVSSIPVLDVGIVTAAGYPNSDHDKPTRTVSFVTPAAANVRFPRPAGVSYVTPFTDAPGTTTFTPNVQGAAGGQLASFGGYTVGVTQRMPSLAPIFEVVTTLAGTTTVHVVFDLQI